MTAAELRRQEHLEQTVRNQGGEIKTLHKDNATLIGIITVLKDVRRKFNISCIVLGWLSITFAFLLCAFDFLAAFLHGTKWSFQFQRGIGLNQLIVIAVSIVLGLVFLIFGYRGKK